MKSLKIISVFVVLAFIYCSKTVPPSDDPILFTVGDKSVTVKEFKARAEFTPRPGFPSQNRASEKIMLNNMIFEKIFALEAGEKSDLEDIEGFQDYIKGIKEQNMREEMFYEKAFNPVKIDTNELKRTFLLSQRQYELEFFTINRDDLAREIKAKIEANPDSAEQIFDALWPDLEQPKWEVKWKDPDHINIHEALYSGPLAQDSVIGPIPLQQNEWIIIKVADWKDVPVIGPEDVQQRFYDINEKLTLNKAARNWEKYTNELMQGKEIKFEPSTFKKLADFARELTLASDQESKEKVLKNFWDNDESGDLTFEDIHDEKAFLDLPFFTIDGNTWTVRDFRKAIASHPLVYRKKQMNASEFYDQFKMAVADLVKDVYVTEQAYKEGLDTNPKVIRKVNIWKDALIAKHERDKLTKQLAANDTTTVGRSYYLGKKFDARLDSLLDEYKDDIHVNFEYFDDIQLTNVQMFVMQQNVPFPVAVPGYPLYTNKPDISYLKPTE